MICWPIITLILVSPSPSPLMTAVVGAVALASVGLGGALHLRKKTPPPVRTRQVADGTRDRAVEMAVEMDA